MGHAGASAAANGAVSASSAADGVFASSTGGSGKDTQLQTGGNKGATSASSAEMAANSGLPFPPHGLNLLPSPQCVEDASMCPSKDYVLHHGISI